MLWMHWIIYFKPITKDAEETRNLFIIIIVPERPKQNDFNDYSPGRSKSCISHTKPWCSLWVRHLVLVLGYSSCRGTGLGPRLNTAEQDEARPDVLTPKHHVPNQSVKGIKTQTRKPAYFTACSRRWKHSSCKSKAMNHCKRCSMWELEVRVNIQIQSDRALWHQRPTTGHPRVFCPSI